MRRSIVAALASLALYAGMFSSMEAAWAQEWPSRPIRLVVPYATGGAVDIVGRILAQNLSKTLGQSVIVENRTGASGVVGTHAVAGAAPDGYALVIGTSGSLAINVHFMTKKLYNPLKDFAPISLIAINDGILIVNPSFPAKSIAEFIETVRKAPGRYSYATSGIGGPTHLAAELLGARAGLSMVHVPYSKGDGFGVLDVIAGNVPVMFTVLAAVAQHVKSGKVRPVAALGAQRFTQLPDLPTVAESGYPGYAAGAWLALLAPAGTPREVVAALNEATRKATADPAYRARLVEMGSTPVGNTPDELASYMRDELDKWGGVIRNAGIKPE